MQMSRTVPTFDVFLENSLRPFPHHLQISQYLRTKQRNYHAFFSYLFLYPTGDANTMFLSQKLQDRFS